MTPSSRAYHYRMVRQFLLMAVFWGLLGTLGGVWLAAVLRWPQLDPGLEMLSFGRLRPAHGLLMMYGFAANAMFAISLFVVQRTAQVRLANPLFSGLAFWGLQAVVLFGALANMAGMGQGGSVFDLPWSLDLLLVLVWLAWIWQMFATLGQRSRAPVYIANWFFISFGVVVMAVHLISSLALPVGGSGLVSYPLFGGLPGAMLQQWQLHTLTICLLAGSYTGVLYYLLPRQLKRPLYSQSFAIVHFWALLPLSVWVGGSYLNWTPMPDWVGGIGTGFSVMLVAAMLAGPVNGALTLKGRPRSTVGDPILRFVLVAMALLVLFSVVGGLYALRGYGSFTLDMGWSGLRIHSLGLGWSAMLAFAGFYYLLPRIWETHLQRPRWMVMHLWLSIIATGLYLGGQWLGAVRQAVGLRQWDQYGNLAYGFRETLALHDAGNLLRVSGGLVFALGLSLLLANILLTRAQGLREHQELERLLGERAAATVGGRGS